MVNIAINGLGRIGKSFLRSLFDDWQFFNNFNLVAINSGHSSIEATYLSIKYDTLMGVLPYDIEYKDNYIYIYGPKTLKIIIIKEIDIKKINWNKLDIDVVIDASGKFLSKDLAYSHIQSGAKYVVITTPMKSEDITIIMGVNEEKFNINMHKIISLSSCTTNAIALPLKVIKDIFQIKSVFVTTVHAYTNSQNLLDSNYKTNDLRNLRAAALNIIPSESGASNSIGKIFPELLEKIFVSSLRVPVAKVSIVDILFSLNNFVSYEHINNILEKAAENELKNLLGFSKEPLVSSDYSGNKNSSVIDSLMTQTYKNYCKIFAWYDNEVGYSNRIKDFLLYFYKIFNKK